MPAAPADVAKALQYKLAVEKINASVKNREAFLFRSALLFARVLQAAGVVAEVQC